MAKRFSGSDGLEVCPGRTEEVFEEALSNYEEREFVRFVGKFGVESLTKLSLATQKKNYVENVRGYGREEICWSVYTMVGTNCEFRYSASSVCWARYISSVR